MILRAMVLLAATMLLSGCWPARFTQRPGVVGTVVSADDHKPIPSAVVKLSPDNGREIARLEVATNAGGRFRIRPTYRWGLYTYLGESWRVGGTVEIEAPGFVPAQRKLYWPQTGASTQDVGVVALVRSP